MKNKGCPIMSDMGGSANCIEDLCAWWAVTKIPARDTGECAVLKIAQSLHSIDVQMPEGGDLV
jgi:hypothetical protein